jgi:hypothetical protein
MGQAVSTAAHRAQAQAKEEGTKVGPAVSAAVHQAQQEARDREATAEVGSRDGTTTAPGTTRR